MLEPAVLSRKRIGKRTDKNSLILNCWYNEMLHCHTATVIKHHKSWWRKIAWFYIVKLKSQKVHTNRLMQIMKLCLQVCFRFAINISSIWGLNMREETWKEKEAKMENEAAHGWGFEFCAAWGFAKLYGFPRPGLAFTCLQRTPTITPPPQVSLCF